MGVLPWSPHKLGVGDTCLNPSFSRFTQTSLICLFVMREAEIFPLLNRMNCNVKLDSCLTKASLVWYFLWPVKCGLPVHCRCAVDLPIWANWHLLFIINTSESHLAIHNFSQSHSWEQCWILPDMLGEFTLEANVAQIDSDDSKLTTGATPTPVLYKKGCAKRLLVFASKNIFSPNIIPKFSRLEKNTINTILWNYNFF